MESAQEVSARLSTWLRTHVELSPPSSIVRPWSASGLGLG